ncbi:trna threonylcarbamoyl adenosine modification protein tsae [Lucifera butyrica]|uniref:tRNA threonylcarbamoyladenosine biosynthesis protein TsaE n=1 Tax=Lucifera butyrica TaxID=1351585 RepID=A0A498R6E3_9FIRM|nr:tRNA (adenosine(37)-N6)-threonylcarbamoyltransferase complex ATPase subunit type 1 TsaE [Lucifera butyrica]VBB05822.1 trna threonylcarbamoyl adenosine modification protein tsae [Lucifera butyrica]
MWIFKTGSPEATFAFGCSLASVLLDGDIVCLQGDLGMGKTVFVQGIARGLDVKEAVTSPTFTILNIYEGKTKLYHFDLYRLETPEELEDIGFDEYTSAGGVAVIEWPDKFPDRLPAECLWVKLEAGEQIADRFISVRAQGERYEKLGEELKHIADSCYRYSHTCV